MKVLSSTKPLNGATLEIYKSRSLFRSERFRWRLTSDNSNILATGSEGYGTQSECEQMAHKVVSGYYWTEGSSA